MANGEEYSIVVEDLTKTYGDFRALDRINFEVRPGEIVGFLGPNGAGKTTTMKILTCFMAATEGTARVAGYDVHDAFAQVRRKVGYLPENVPLYDDMLVYDYLNFIAEVRGVSRDRRDAQIRRVAERTGLESVISREISELSKGYRQRVGLAQAIIHEPDVLILDEPTTGLDPNQIVEIRDVITDIGQEKTIIFSTHILQEVTAVCDRIIIINRGKIVADGTLEELEAAVEQSAPGFIVEYDASHDDETITTELYQLAGAPRLERLEQGSGRQVWLVDTPEVDAARAELLAVEADKQLGLVGIRRTEPTLEDIFRVYTHGSTEEAGADARSRSTAAE